MNEIGIELSQAVEEVMRRWPATIPVFARHRMACIGCPVAAFHTVAESSFEYDISATLLLAELNAAAVSRDQR